MRKAVSSPSPTNASLERVRIITGGIVIIVVSYLFIVYGLPVFRNMLLGTTQIHPPGGIDLNIIRRTN